MSTGRTGRSRLDRSGCAHHRSCTPGTRMAHARHRTRRSRSAPYRTGTPQAWRPRKRSTRAGDPRSPLHEVSRGLELHEHMLSVGTYRRKRSPMRGLRPARGVSGTKALLRTWAWASVRLSRPADDQGTRLAAGESEHRRWSLLPTSVAHSRPPCRSGDLNARSAREGAKMGSNTS
jgi:hypothetical protein